MVYVCSISGINRIYFNRIIMEITKNTFVSNILREYGDIAEVMELLGGVRRVGGYGLRRFLTRFITVRMAAFVHRKPLDTFMASLKAAVAQKQEWNEKDNVSHA